MITCTTQPTSNQYIIACSVLQTSHYIYSKYMNIVNLCNGDISFLSQSYSQNKQCSKTNPQLDFKSVCVYGDGGVSVEEFFDSYKKKTHFQNNTKNDAMVVKGVQLQQTKLSAVKKKSFTSVPMILKQYKTQLSQKLYNVLISLD